MKPLRIPLDKARKFVQWLQDERGGYHAPGPMPPYHFERMFVDLGTGAELLVLYENSKGLISIPAGTARQLYQEFQDAHTN